MCLVKVLFVLYGVSGSPVYEVCLTQPEVQEEFHIQCIRQHIVITNQEETVSLVSTKPVCKSI